MIQNDTVKKVLRTVGGFLVATLINFLLFYLMLPPINIFSRSFWFFLMLVLIIYGSLHHVPPQPSLPGAGLFAQVWPHG